MPNSQAATPKRRNRCPGGFSLIELMIVVAIVAILAAVAYPTYMNSIRQGRRSDAISALNAMQQAQERWRANNTAYTSNTSDIGAPATSPTGYYSLNIDSASGYDYVMTATAVTGTSQAGDTNCTVMRVGMHLGSINYGGCNACAAPATSNLLTDSNNCWNKQ